MAKYNMEGLKLIFLVLCVVTKHSSSELVSQDDGQGNPPAPALPPNGVAPSQFQAPNIIEGKSREDAGIPQGVQSNPTLVDNDVKQNEGTQLGDMDSKVVAEPDPQGDPEESQVNTDDDLETVSRNYGNTQDTDVDKNTPPVETDGTGDDKSETKATQQDDDDNEGDDDENDDYDDDDEDWYDPNDFEEEDENTMKDYVGADDEDSTTTTYSYDDDDDEEYKNADWKPHVKETDDGDESEDLRGRNEEDDDDEDYDISQWSKTDNENDDSDYDEEDANNAQDDFDEHGIHEDVVDEELAKKNRPPTAPSSMVLFYTWMIVVILIMVVGISTYQSRCRGFKLFGSKSSPQTDDKKRLLEHEYV